MRITIETEAPDAVPVVSSTPNQTSTSASYEGGSAPSAMQAAPTATTSGASLADIDAGQPSAELVSAMQAASAMIPSNGAIDGGIAPRM